MKPSRVVWALGLAVLTACAGGGGDDSTPSFAQYTPNGYPVVAGDYTVTSAERTNSCEAVNPTPTVDTITIRQDEEDHLTAIEHGLDADIAALEAAGYTLSALSPNGGTVTADAHFPLSQGVTLTHPTIGTVNGTNSYRGVFTPTGGSGTGEVAFLYDNGGRCTSTSEFTTRKS